MENLSFYSVGHRAFCRDAYDNVYADEALYLALLMRCKVVGRTKEHLDEVGKLLDDPNLKEVG